MKVGRTCAASVRHTPHSWAGSAVTALIGWRFTPGVSEAACAASSPNACQMLSVWNGMTESCFVNRFDKTR